MKSLAKQTAVYGISNILGKFLNWCLVPLYTYVLTSSEEYGIVTNLYAWTALLLVILTCGMETGFFRFANKEDMIPRQVYGTTLSVVGTLSLMFTVLVMLFSGNIAELMGYGEHPEFVSIMGVIVALDAFDCIPFAYLRFKKKAGKFALLKFLMVLVNIGANLFFLILCPKIYQSNPELVSWFFNPNYSVGYVFVSNLISTGFVTLMLLPELKEVERPDMEVLKRMLRYSAPMIILGIAGIMNQSLDKIIFPYLYADAETANAQLGIYGACFKVAMVMMVFTQAFRYAYEPFVFAQSKGGGKKTEYSLAMKFFVIFSLLIFLGMTFYLDILKHLIHRSYWEGLKVVPIILISYIFQGIYFNLSLWYKLTDDTKWGAILSTIGLVVTVAINFLFVPEYGYMASAGASFLCYLTIMTISYFLGQKHYPIDYDLKSLALYFFVAMALYYVSTMLPQDNALVYYCAVTLMLALYVGLILKRDLPIESVPVVGRCFRKTNNK